MRASLARWRRPLAAAFAAASVGFGLQAVRPVATSPQAPGYAGYQASRAGAPQAGQPDGLRPDLAAVPVRIADAGAVRLLHPGDRIDLFAPAPDPAGLGPPGGAARFVARSVPVLAIPPESAETDSGQGGLVVLGAAHGQAEVLAGAGPHLTIAIVSAPGG